LVVVNVSVGFSASILRVLALPMDNKVKFQFFSEIFLTATIRHGVISCKIRFFPFPPEEERNAQFLNPFTGQMAMPKILFRPIVYGHNIF